MVSGSLVLIVGTKIVVRLFIAIPANHCDKLFQCFLCHPQEAPSRIRHLGLRYVRFIFASKITLPHDVMWSPAEHFAISATKLPPAARNRSVNRCNEPSTTRRKCGIDPLNPRSRKTGTIRLRTTPFMVSRSAKALWPPTGLYTSSCRI